MSFKIDFILTWVNGNDPEWQDERQQYLSDSKGDSRNVRFRDWDNLEFWFRAVEKFAPWVNKIHFITWGHTPSWLEIKHPKLNIVKHTDFIPEKYLPTYNSHTIELNFHNIEGLAEHFVYFNDDTFLTQPVNQNFFFKNELPCDSAILSPVIGNFINSASPIIINNMELINTEFIKNKVIFNNITKWFNIKYKNDVIKNILLMPWSKFVGFENPHLPLSYMKSTYEEIWGKYYNVLNETCNDKFRSKSNVNQWVFRYWQLTTGKFYPSNPNRGKCYSLTNDNDKIFNSITLQKHKMTCINDNDKEPIDDFEKEKLLLRESFQNILPHKSSFEI